VAQLELEFDSDDHLQRQAPRAETHPLVYFSGPLTWYAKHRPEALDTVTTAAQVVDDCLTPLGVEVYIPHRHYPLPTGHAAYAYNRMAIARSWLVVAFYDYPSTGMGQELEIAADHLRPVILLVNERRHNISTMISGAFVRYAPLEFDTLDDIERDLPSLAQELMRPPRRSRPEGPSTLLSPRIRSTREAAGMSRKELAIRAGCSAALIEHLETEQSDLLNPSLQQIARIADALGLDVRQLLGLELVNTMNEEVLSFAVANGHSLESAVGVLRLAARAAPSDDLRSERALRQLFALVAEAQADEAPNRIRG
jgi:transcriptional regulator with XRE-family HTH domain